jgi:hypothetical protein
MAADELPAHAFGSERALLLPAVSASVGEMIESVRRIGGAAAADRIALRPDERIQRIVDGWPAGIRADRALSFGLRAEASITEIVDTFVATDLPAMRELAPR